MKLENSVVFVTGANRGLGLFFAKQALAQGADQVLADEATRQVHAALSGYPDIYLKAINH